MLDRINRCSFHGCGVITIERVRGAGCSRTRAENTMEPNNDIEYEHKSVRNQYPPNRLIVDVDEFFEGSSVIKEISALSIAKIAQDMLVGLIR
jgi:hypothetical protein